MYLIIYYYIKLIADNSRAGFEKRQKRRQIRALQEAIDQRDTTAVEKILEDDFDVDFQYRSQTALQLAVREGCYNICKLLIDRKANVNMSDAEQNNLLNLACSRGIICLTFLSAYVIDLYVHTVASVNSTLHCLRRIGHLPPYVN